jgi:hypothetical protein
VAWLAYRERGTRAIDVDLTLRGVLPHGFAQRVGNIIFQAWFILMSVRLIRLGDQEAFDVAKAV